MRLIGLMLVRNEEWAVRAALKTALCWCDAVSVLMDRCTDGTAGIVREIAYDEGYARVPYEFTTRENLWMEMDHRQRSLETGRAIGGTHFAVIDGDEVLTANLFGRGREWFEMLKPGEVLELPRIAPTSFDAYWDDNHEHAQGALTLGFCDRPDLAWRPRGPERYHFHARPPAGSGPIQMPLGRDRSQGGVMHLQYMNRNRMRAKSLWYMLNERVRWPERKTPRELNAIYSAMLDTPQVTRPIPPEWWTEEKALINHNESESWHLQECREMIKTYGRKILDGLNTHGYEM